MAKTPNNQSGKNSAPVAETNPENTVFYKIIWFALFGFVAFVLLNTLKNDPLAPVKETEETFAFLDGSYQEHCEQLLLEKPFISNFKKLKNKYDYRFYKKVNLEDAYTGKAGYVYSGLMTKAYFGDDFHGDAAIREEVRKAKFVQEKLKEQGIELLIMFAPGKNSIYPEYMPDYINKTKKKPTNYGTYMQECRKLKVNTLDFVEYFKQLKPKSKYALFPKYGSHWSYYAECMVVDTTIKRLEKMMRVNLPNIRFDNIKEQDSARFRDADIFGKVGMDAPRDQLLAYPQNIGFETGGDVRPQKVLGIGDSFFRGFYYIGALKYAFADGQQWYYYNSIIPESPLNPEVWELDLKAEILKQKAIVILCNESNLKNLGNGFIDDAYELFSNPKKYYAEKAKKDKINKAKKQIRNDKQTLSRLTKDALKKGITLDSLITETAIKRLNP